MAKHTSVKRTPITGAEAVFFLKQCLVSAGWVVLGSGNGSSYNSSGDVIATYADLSVVNSWFRIRDPGARRELVLQRVADNTAWRVKFSEFAGFVGGTPGAARAPSATDEQVLLGSGTDASPTGAQWFNTDGTYRCHTIAFSDPVATNVYSVFFFATDLITGLARTFLFIDGTDQKNALDVSPLLIMCAYRASGLSFTNDLNTATLGNNVFKAWVLYGTGSASFSSVRLSFLGNSTSSMSIPATSSTIATSPNPITGYPDVCRIVGAVADVKGSYKGMCLRLAYSGAAGRAFPDMLNKDTDAMVWVNAIFVVPWENGTLAEV